VTDRGAQEGNVKTSADPSVIIVGAGLAGLSCARRLMQDSVPFLILEADRQIGGRVRTEKVDGFLLNHGFQVLQTAYPEARRLLDFQRLELKTFAPGAMIRAEGRFFRVADPRRRPRDLWSTLKAPIGTLGDRLRIVRLARNARQTTVAGIFHAPDMPTVEFLPYLILNGEGLGWVNSLTVPSTVAPSYAPAGHALISVVVTGHVENRQ